MSAVDIQFKLTSAGVNEAFYKAGQTLNLNITHVQIGSGNRTPNGNETALVTPVEYAAITSHWEVSVEQHRIAAAFPGNANVFNISEIGLWSGVPGGVGSVLVFYFSQPAGHVAVKSLNVDFNFEDDLFFGGVVPSNITIVADTQFNSLAMIAAHAADPDAHSAYATKIGVRDSIYNTAAAGGTVNAITATFTPTVTALVNGATVFVKASGANTVAAPTFSPDGLAAIAIVKGSNLPLVAGDISGANFWMELRYDSSLAKWVLMNPATGAGSYVSGQVLQTVSSVTGAVATGSGTIPYDDTIPQDSEGTEFLSLAITPKSSNSKIIIEAKLNLGSSAGGNLSSAAFLSGVANAIVVTTNLVGAGGAAGFQPTLFAEYINTSTAAKTFKVRAGNSAAATVTLNGEGGVRKFGGVLLSSIKLTEVSQ